MKEKSNAYLLWPYGEKLIFALVARSSLLFEILRNMIKHHPSSIIFTNIQTLMFFYVPTKDYSPKSFFCICSAIPNPTFTESEEISIIVSLHEHSI